MNESLQVLAALRRRPRQGRGEEERCDLCAAPVPAGHRHLVEVQQRRIACACDSCAILFPAQAGARYKEVPRDRRRLPDFSLTDAQWESLMIPINIAFFLRSSEVGEQTVSEQRTADTGQQTAGSERRAAKSEGRSTNRVTAFYPSPAGAMESLLDLTSWNEIAGALALREDVEALVVNRLRVPHRYYVLPIDHCYRLVGLIRTNWRGLSGGAEVWEQIDRFFDEVPDA
jgi:hypothetical protein